MSDKIYRNIQEQVLKNAQDIAKFKELTGGVIGVQGEQGPQGPQGPKGNTGERGNKWTVSSEEPLDPINGDCWLQPSGLVREYKNGVWIDKWSLRGPQGILGPQGPRGEQGPQGPQGILGPQGPRGEQFDIKGPVASTDNLPEPSTVPLNTVFLVGSSAPYYLYVVSNGNTWVNVGSFASLDNVQKIIINAPESATSGTFSQDEMNIIKNSDCVIQLGYDIYHLTEDQTQDGYIVFSSFNNAGVSTITILNVGSWTKSYYPLKGQWTAKTVSYDNSSSGLESDNVQGAIDEVYSNIVDNNLVYHADGLSATGRWDWDDQLHVIINNLVPEETYTLSIGSQTGSHYNFNIRFYNEDGEKIGNDVVFAPDVLTQKFVVPQNAVRTWFNCPLMEGVEVVLNDFNIFKGDATTQKLILQPKVYLREGQVEIKNTDFIKDNLIYQGDMVIESNVAEDINIFNKKIEFKDTTKGLTFKLSNFYLKEEYPAYGLSIWNYDENGSYLGGVGLALQNGEKEKFVMLPERTKSANFVFSFYPREGQQAPYKISIENLQIYEGFVSEYTSKVQPTFKYDQYGVPVLKLTGNTYNMTKDTAVNMSWEFKGQSGSCTCKWQGTSSLAFPKKNYTIKLENAIDFGFGSQKKYCLKANWVDRTHTRNIACARIYAKCLEKMPNFETNYPLLASAPNKGAVDGYPICLTINGQYQGIYTFNIPKDGWMMNMGTGTQEAILSAENLSGSGFNSSPVLGTDFDIEYITDENNTAWAQEQLTAIYNAVVSRDLTAIGQLVDLDNVLTYIVFSRMIANPDGLYKNYLLCKFDNTKWFIMAYDLDLTFGNWFNEFGLLNSPTTDLANGLFKTVFELSSPSVVNEVVDRLTTEGREYPLSVNQVCKVINEVANKIPTALLNEEVKIWNTLPSTQTDTVDRINFAYLFRYTLAVKWSKK